REGAVQAPLWRSVDALERRRLAPVGGGCRCGIGRAEQLGGEALVADLLRNVGAGAAARSQTAGWLFERRRRLFAGLAGARGVDPPARPLGGGDFLRSRRTRLGWPQIEIGRDRQRRPRFDGKLVGRHLLEANRPL